MCMWIFKLVLAFAGWCVVSDCAHFLNAMIGMLFEPHQGLRCSAKPIYIRVVNLMNNAVLWISCGMSMSEGSISNKHVTDHSVLCPLSSDGLGGCECCAVQSSEPSSIRGVHGQHRSKATKRPARTSVHLSWAFKLIVPDQSRAPQDPRRIRPRAFRALGEG